MTPSPHGPITKPDACMQGGGWIRPFFFLCIQLEPQTYIHRPLPWHAWPIADGNLSERRLAWLIGTGFKKVCIIMIRCSSTEFQSTLAVLWNGDWNCPTGLSYTDLICHLGVSFFEGELLAGEIVC
jgi:hypothetical protein